MSVKRKDVLQTNSNLSAERHALAKAVRAGLCVGGTAVMLSISPVGLSQSTFSAVMELSELDGTDGFMLKGIDAYDGSGRSVSGAGDINGDGIDDLIIGADDADSNGTSDTGESYVVFGGASIGSSGSIELSSLDGVDGFVLNGIDAGDQSISNFSRAADLVSSAGDINDDGFDDLIIGANTADPNGNSAAGESYVVFGGLVVGSSGSIELSSLDGNDGFVLNGVGVGDRSGYAVSSAGDINGDGLDDLLIGAVGADLNGDGYAGQSYVVFGGMSIGGNGSIELSSLDGSNGFVLNGIDSFDWSGRSVGDVGDINNDGFDDLVIGADRAAPNGDTRAGESYVVFGGASVGNSGSIELSSLDGNDGFVLNGTDVFDYSGASVDGAGDVNGDGISDLIVGAVFADPNATFNAGESYVVFGDVDIGNSGSIELSGFDGTDGFVLNGIDIYHESGRSVGSAGDINGDGIDDLIIGANGGGNNEAGESYVVFGGIIVGSGGSIELSDLDGSNGFVLKGIDAFDRSGGSVGSAGDINGDGIDDLIVGANGADPNGNNSAGESYVIFGKDVPQCNGLFVTVDLNFDQTPGPGSDVILGTEGNDDIRGRAGNDTICGMGGDDFIHGNSGDDWIDGGDGIDDLRGGQGNDVVNTGSGSTVGTLSIAFGGTGDDEINGGADADDLRGGRGIDTINGNAGDDVIRGNADGDILIGGSGFDTLRGGGGDDDLRGGADDDVLSGGSGSSDLCNGGGGTGDTATESCETVTNVP